MTIAAPLDRLPLLVRAGAILPLGPVVQHTGERPLDELTLQIYPEGASRFELYEDDGRSNALSPRATTRSRPSRAWPSRAA